MKAEHPNLVEFEVTAPIALFSDPLMRVGGEKCSYPVPTYEALKGILHSIYWKPTIIWYVDQVRVLQRIRTETRGARPLVYDGQGKKRSGLAYHTYLKDCRYQVRAHFEWNENRPEMAADRNENKHHQTALRMIRRGGRRDVFLGTRECQGYVTPCVFGEGEGAYDGTEEMDLGWMLHGFTYPDEAYSDATRGMLSVRFWHAVMRRGVIAFPRPEDCAVKPVRPMEAKRFTAQTGTEEGGK